MVLLLNTIPTHLFTFNGLISGHACLFIVQTQRIMSPSKLTIKVWLGGAFFAKGVAVLN